MEINTKKLGEIYKEWRGNESCYDNGRPVFEADELLDFAEFLLKHEANGTDKSSKSCHIQNVMASAFDCLKNIANPINYMQEQAEKDGCKLNGQMAISLSEDANYLKGLANNFLARHLP